jgi:putative hydrolase of the HAD superfamily
VTPPHTILLDLDDTIIDFGGNVEAAWRCVCRDACELPGLDPDALFAAIDRVRTWYWSDPERHRQGRQDLRAAGRRIVEQALHELGFMAPDLARRIAERYRDLRDEAMRLFPGAIETLERVRQRGARLGLVTNGSAADQRAKIARFALARHFDHIQIEGEFGHGKPDARVYHAALTALDATPETTWFVGDNLEWDVAAPQRLGIYAVWVDGRRSGVPPGAPATPDRIIHTLAEL